MLAIRLARIGKKNKSQYRIVVQEKSKATSSRFIEQVGFYNPHTESNTVQLKEERIKYWLSKGAQASPTVFNMLIANKIVEGSPIPLGRSKKKKSAKGEKEEKKQEQKPKETKEEKKEKAGEDASKKKDEKEKIKEDTPKIEKKKENQKEETTEEIKKE